MTDTSQLVTPEAVVLGLRTAGAATRTLARLIDAVVLMAITLGYLLLLGAVSSAGLSDTVVTISVFFFVFAALFLYPLISELLLRGRTVGKLAMGLRVVTTEGAPIRFRHAAIRAFADIVDIWLTFGGVALIASVASKRDQRIGDMVAGTLVVRERGSARAPTAVGFAVPPGYEEYARTVDVAGLGGDDYQAIRSFLLRSSDLRPEARGQLARELAGGIAARLRHTPPPWITPELFLVVVAALQQRRSAAQQPVAPAGWGAGAPPPYGQSPPYGHAPPYGQSPPYGHAPPYGQTPGYGQSSPYGQQLPFAPPAASGWGPSAAPPADGSPAPTDQQAAPAPTGPTADGGGFAVPG